MIGTLDSRPDRFEGFIPTGYQQRCYGNSCHHRLLTGSQATEVGGPFHQPMPGNNAYQEFTRFRHDKYRDFTGILDRTPQMDRPAIMASRCQGKKIPVAGRPARETFARRAETVPTINACGEPESKMAGCRTLNQRLELRTVCRDRKMPQYWCLSMVWVGPKRHFFIKFVISL